MRTTKATNGFPKLSERLRTVYKSKLRVGDKALLAYLSYRVDSETGETWVGLGRMARECGFGHSTLVHRLKALVRKGWVERVRRGRNAEDGHNLTSITRLLPEKFGSLKSGIPDFGIPAAGIPAAGIPENRGESPKSGIPKPGRNPGRSSIRSLSGKSIAAGKRRQAAGEPDKRHGEVREHIQARWLEKNPTAPTAPWDAAEGKNLAQFLAANPLWDVVQIKRCVDHRFGSEVNHSDRPRKWLPDLASYAAGPIDRYGKPLTGKGSKDERSKAKDENFAAAAADLAE